MNFVMCHHNLISFALDVLSRQLVSQIVTSWQITIQTTGDNKTMMLTVTLGFILLLDLLSLGSAQICQVNGYGHVDGCSIPFGIHLFYKDEFTPSCNLHDICYFCGGHFGKTRDYCDTTFYHNLLNYCSHLNKRFLFGKDDNNACEAAAWTYYEAVKGFAGSHFESPSPSWCTQSWVRGCL